MVIKKYKFHCYFKRAPRDNIWIEASSFRSHEREGERKERKKKRGKTLHLFVSSRLRFIGHPLSSHTRYSNAFSPLFFTRSLLFRDIGLTLAPATTSKPEAEDPPRHPGATPVIRSSIVHPSPSPIVISSTLSHDVSILCWKMFIHLGRRNEDSSINFPN